MRNTIFILVLAAACGSKGPKLEPKPVGDSGFVIDTPAGWTVKMDMPGFFSTESPDKSSGQAQIIVETASSARTLDDVLRDANCEDASKATKETEPNGTVFVQCGVKNGSFKLTRVRAVAFDGAKHASAECHLDTDKPKAAELVATICKSLRKQ